MMTSDTEDEQDGILSEIDEMILGIDGVTAHDKVERLARVRPREDDFSDREQDDQLKDHKNHEPPVPFTSKRRRFYPSGRIAGKLVIWEYGMGWYRDP